MSHCALDQETNIKIGRNLTFGQISRDARTIGSNLLKLGLDPAQIHKLPPTPSCREGAEISPIVLIQLPNGLAFAPVLLGVFAAGLTATLVSPALTSTEISWILQNARPRVIITAKNCLGAMHEALKQQEDQTFFGKIPIFTVDAADTYPLSPSPSTKTPVATQKEVDWKTLLSTSSPISLAKSVFPGSSSPEPVAPVLDAASSSSPARLLPRARRLLLIDL